MRDNITSIRPAIDAELQTVSPIEAFQNQTLRPILKYQNELLLAIMRQNFEKRKGEFYKIKEDTKAAYLEQTVRKDLRFKSLLFGVIIGFFSSEELTFFNENEAELSRRLTELLVQRFVSQVADFQ